MVVAEGALSAIWHAPLTRPSNNRPQAASIGRRGAIVLRESTMTRIRPILPLSRRALLRRAAQAGGGLGASTLLPARAFSQAAAPAVITSERMRPSLPYGVQTGDL